MTFKEWILKNKFSQPLTDSEWDTWVISIASTEDVIQWAEEWKNPKMKKFSILYQANSFDTVCSTTTIEAESEEDATDKFKKQYPNGYIVDIVVKNKN